MKNQKRDVVVIGGGPAGLAAALAARKKGCLDVLLVERAGHLGGILNQCIHEGFGLRHFKEALSGPEYARRFIDEFAALGLEAMLGTMVLNLDADRNLLVSSARGLERIQAGAVILAMGCRERPAGAIGLPGTRPAGVYTAGVAQRLINLQNIMVGRRVVIMGSGDIGLIMARRLTLEGARVEGVFEIMPYAGGLARNIQQCLHDYGIPLHLGTSVVQVHGRQRVEGLTVAAMNPDLTPMAGTQRFIPADTLLLSVGLIPENELSRAAGLRMDPVTGGAWVDETLMTSVPGIFSCGNVLHVHDLVDYVSEEAARAGENAVEYLTGGPTSGPPIPVVAGPGVRSVLPQALRGGRDTILSLRVTTPARDRAIRIGDGDRKIIRKKMTRLHPAEMIRIRIPADKLAGVGGLEVTVE